MVYVHTETSLARTTSSDYTGTEREKTVSRVGVVGALAAMCAAMVVILFI